MVPVSCVLSILDHSRLRNRPELSRARIRPRKVGPVSFRGGLRCLGRRSLLNRQMGPVVELPSPRAAADTAASLMPVIN